jgi:4-aminobutyrate aminotransferase-like enzyme
LAFQETIGIPAPQYQEHVNPQWVRLLDALQMNVRYRRCNGAELQSEDGRRFLDFLSGYCVHNTGHNHPAIRRRALPALSSYPRIFETQLAMHVGAGSAADFIAHSMLPLGLHILAT